MLRFYWQKLVPDKVVHHSEIDPKVVRIVYRRLDDEEYHRELVRKVDEEAREILWAAGAPDEALKELADVQIVVDTLRDLHGFTEVEVKEAMARKMAYRGGLEKRHYVEYVDLANDSEWVEVFRAQPDKYREEAL